MISYSTTRRRMDFCESFEIWSISWRIIIVSLSLSWVVIKKTRNGTINGQNTLYRGEKKGLQYLLSYIQAGPGRKVKQGQEEISRNQTPTIFLVSVCLHDLSKLKQERKSILQKVKLFSRVQKWFFLTNIKLCKLQFRLRTDQWLTHERLIPNGDFSQWLGLPLLLLCYSHPPICSGDSDLNEGQ